MITFESFFDRSVPVEGSAPGRINLLGNYAAHHDSCVLTVATPVRTTVAIAASRNDAHHFYSEELADQVLLGRRGHLASGFGQYVEACIRTLEREGYDIPPLRVYVGSSVPIDVGFSSSTALEVATLRALGKFLGARFNDVDVAMLAQKAEFTLTGVHCGIIDQLTASLCEQSHMLFLDTRSLEGTVLAMPPSVELLVIDSGLSRTLAAAKYEVRRSECETAVFALGMTSLRDVSDPAALERIAQPYRSRARHVVSENGRAQFARRGLSASRLGKLINESQASLREDYEVSTGAVDFLCELLRTTPGVYGARLTGSGGACLALCEKGASHAIGAAVLAKFNTGGRWGRILLPQAARVNLKAITT